MWQNRLNGILGLWVVALAFLGFSVSMHRVLLVITGLAITTIAFLGGFIIRPAKDVAAASKAEQKKGAAYIGPICTIKALDLGIALGSAAKTAQIHNVDNRLFYRAGAAAVKMNLMPDCPIILCIPLSATGKSVFFDR